MKALRVAIFIAPFLVIAAGFGLWHLQSLRDGADGIAVKRLEREQTYLAVLRDRLQSSSEADLGAMASAFISVASINAVLAGLEGIRIPLQKPVGVTLDVESVRTQFLDGFPEVVAKAHITHTDSTVKVGVLLTLVLEPRLDDAHPNVIQLYAKPTGLTVDASLPALGVLTPSQVSEVLRDLTVHYAETLPYASIPLAETLSIAQPVGHLPVDLPTGNGRLRGVVVTPPLSSTIPINISGLLFLSDGLHVLLGVGPGSLDLTPFFKPSKAGAGLVSEAALKEEAARLTLEVKKLRTEIEPKLASIKVSDSDFRLWVSKGALVQLDSVFNSLTEQQRTIQYSTTSEEGQIYEQGGGGAGCGGFANVVGGNSATAQIKVGRFATAWTEQGLKASADLEFAFRAQVKAHMRGAAGPHVYMGLQCLLGVCTDVPQVTVSCRTPVGGGVSLGSYGVSGTRTERITVNTTLRSDPSSWLIYDVAIVSPDEMPMTISVGLGQLGTVGIPIKFKVPHTTLMSGKAPPLFAQSGEVALASIGLRRAYDVALVPVAGVVGPTGYASKGNVKITWREPLANSVK